MTGPVQLISFGYGHAPAPVAHATFDVRHHFRDPHADPALRALTAEDGRVTAAVMRTPGAAALASAIADTARAFLAGPVPGPVVIAVGCVGGRHRSAAIAAAAARLLEHAGGVTVTVTHRDIRRPVITRPAGGAR